MPPFDKLNIRLRPVDVVAGRVIQCDPNESSQSEALEIPPNDPFKVALENCFRELEHDRQYKRLAVFADSHSYQIVVHFWDLAEPICNTISKFKVRKLKRTRDLATRAKKIYQEVLAARIAFRAKKAR